MTVSATKILWGQVLVVFTIVLASVWSATQWTAAALGHQHQLGSPWFTAFDVPVYPPPAFFWWWFSFDAYAPDIFQRGAYIAVSGGFVSRSEEHTSELQSLMRISYAVFCLKKKKKQIKKNVYYEACLANVKHRTKH